MPQYERPIWCLFAVIFFHILNGVRQLIWCFIELTKVACRFVEIICSAQEFFQAKDYLTATKIFEAALMYLSPNDKDYAQQRAKNLRILCICHLASHEYDRASDYVDVANKVRVVGHKSRVKTVYAQKLRCFLIVAANYWFLNAQIEPNIVGAFLKVSIFLQHWSCLENLLQILIQILPED